MTSHVYPIVGYRFHPPAKAILDTLAIHTPLILMAERTNPHDPNAIQILVDTTNIPDASKAALLQIHNIGLPVGEIHLGYIPRGLTDSLRSHGFTAFAWGRFLVGAHGGPYVEVLEEQEPPGATAVAVAVATATAVSE